MIPSNRALADQAIFLTLGQFIAYAGNLIVGVILVRMVNAADYGTFLQVNLVFSMAVSILIFGLPASLFYFIPQRQADDVKRFVVQHLVILLLIGTTAAGFLYASGPYLAMFMNNSRIEGLIGYIILLLVLGILNEAVEPTLISINKANMVAGLNIAFVGCHLLLIPALLWMGYGLEGIFMAMGGLQGLKLLALCIYLLRLPGPVLPILRIKEVVEQVRYSLPLGSARVLSNARPKVDQFMISYWYTPDLFGIYARGAFTLPVTSMVVGNVSNVLLPRLVELAKANRIDEVFGLWQGAMKKVSLITLPLFVFFLLFAHEFIVLLFTEAYRDSAVIFAIYLCSIPLEVFVFGHLHQAFGRTKYIFISNLLGLPSAILLNILFHALFGFTGPAVALVVTKFLTMGFHLAVIRNYFAVSFSKVFPWAYQGKLLGLCFIAGGLVYPMKWTAVPGVVVLAVSAALFALSYIWIIERFGYLSPDVIEMVKSRMPFPRVKKFLYRHGTTRS
jgi:O-antigen/teichoic acid export membrane protein